MDSPMTAEQVEALVRLQSTGNLTLANDHRMTLADALIPPQRISVIFRQVTNGRTQDEILSVWLVGRENEPDGYKIILRDDGLKFGLASIGWPDDKYPVLDGWYGSLVTTFIGM